MEKELPDEVPPVSYVSHVAAIFTRLTRNILQQLGFYEENQTNVKWFTECKDNATLKMTLQIDWKITSFFFLLKKKLFFTLSETPNYKAEFSDSTNR